jgi:hypothetical protein
MDGSDLLAALRPCHDVAADEIRGEFVDLVGDDDADLVE